MKQLWQERLWNLGAVLLATTLVSLGLAVVLSSAGDDPGRQFVLGAAAVTGLAFAADLLVWALITRFIAVSDDGVTWIKSGVDGAEARSI